MAKSASQSQETSFGQLFVRECVRALPWLAMVFVALLITWAVVVRPVVAGYERAAGQLASLLVGEPFDTLTPLNAEQITRARGTIKRVIDYAASAPIERAQLMLEHEPTRKRLASGFQRALRRGIVIGLDETSSVVRRKRLIARASKKIKKAIDFSANRVAGEVNYQALNSPLIPKIKQTSKEAFEFAAAAWWKPAQEYVPRVGR